MATSLRNEAKLKAYGRQPRKCEVPVNEQGRYLKVSQYYGENVYNYHLSKSLSLEDKETLKQVIEGKKTINRELATKVANSVLKRGGILAVNTPDSASLWARLFGKRWHILINDLLIRKFILPYTFSCVYISDNPEDPFYKYQYLFTASEDKQSLIFDKNRLEEISLKEKFDIFAYLSSFVSHARHHCS